MRTRLTIITMLAVGGTLACGSATSAPLPVEPTPPPPRPATTLGCAGPAITSAIAYRPLFDVVDSTAALSPAAATRLALVRALPWVACVSIGRIPADVDSMLVAGRTVAIAVEPGRVLLFAVDRAGRNESGSLSWSGPLIGRFGSVQAVSSALGITGTIRVEAPRYDTYSLEPLGDGFEAIVRIDDSRLPQID
jgi:hypothetical protein